jgi:hypothetical protein
MLRLPPVQRFKRAGKTFVIEVTPAVVVNRLVAETVAAPVPQMGYATTFQKYGVPGFRVTVIDV